MIYIFNVSRDDKIILGSRVDLLFHVYFERTHTWRDAQETNTHLGFSFLSFFFFMTQISLENDVGGFTIHRITFIF
jgi:hypothetical protein